MLEDDVDGLIVEGEHDRVGVGVDELLERAGGELGLVVVPLFIEGLEEDGLGAYVVRLSGFAAEDVQEEHFVVALSDLLEGEELAFVIGVTEVDEDGDGGGLLDVGVQLVGAGQVDGGGPALFEDPSDDVGRCSASFVVDG